MHNETSSMEAEQAVLGGLLELSDLSQEIPQKVLSMLKPASFAFNAHRTIYKALVAADKSNALADLINIDSYLERNGQSVEVGGFAYLADLLKSGSAVNIVAHAEIVRQSAVERVVSSTLTNAIAMLSNRDGRTVYEKLGEVESTISTLLSRSVQNKTAGLRHISEIANEWTEELNQRFDGSTDSLGFKTGIECLDNILFPKFIPSGALAVIGARPKMGKTALLNMITTNTSLNNAGKVAVFSLEMPSKQLFERMIVERARVKTNVLYNNSSDLSNTDEEFAKITRAMGEFIESKLHVDDTPSITLSHVKREARKLAKDGPIDLIALDYLTLMSAEKAERNDLAYGEITKGLKALAKELDCVVLLLTQLNRNLEKRPDKRPMPSDSKDTGQIEQDCDLWIGLYREGVYNDNLADDQKGLTEAIVRLNRHGEGGTAHLDLKDGYFVEAAPFSFEDKKYNKNDY